MNYILIYKTLNPFIYDSSLGKPNDNNNNVLFLISLFKNIFVLIAPETNIQIQRKIHLLLKFANICFSNGFIIFYITFLNFILLTVKKHIVKKNLWIMMPKLPLKLINWSSNSRIRPFIANCKSNFSILIVNFQTRILNQ